MSYEGRIQQICKNGHYNEVDVYASDQDQCQTCKARIIWENSIDDTNGESSGYIELLPEVTHVCETCGHEVNIYCPPDYNEVVSEPEYEEENIGLDYVTPNEQEDE